jgi:C-terminal of NADH-ubiquinone oxidoreductase 21 kDa subunit
VDDGKGASIRSRQTRFRAPPTPGNRRGPHKRVHHALHPLISLVSPPICNQFLMVIVRFYGMRENKREQDMDMREMVDKVKKGEPLYGVSNMSPYMQGVAARNSRYTAVFHHMVPWMNFVNHNQVCVLTRKVLRVLTTRSMASIQPSTTNKRNENLKLSSNGSRRHRVSPSPGVSRINVHRNYILHE